MHSQFNPFDIHRSDIKGSESGEGHSGKQGKAGFSWFFSKEVVSKMPTLKQHKSNTVLIRAIKIPVMLRFM